MIPNQKQLASMLNALDPGSDPRSLATASGLALSAVKADSKLPSSIQLILVLSLLNALFEGYKLPIRLSLVTDLPTQK